MRTEIIAERIVPIVEYRICFPLSMLSLLGLSILAISLLPNFTNSCLCASLWGNKPTVHSGQLWRFSEHRETSPLRSILPLHHHPRQQPSSLASSSSSYFYPWHQWTLPGADQGSLGSPRQ